MRKTKDTKITLFLNPFFKLCTSLISNLVNLYINLRIRACKSLIISAERRKCNGNKKSHDKQGNCSNFKSCELYAVALVRAHVFKAPADSACFKISKRNKNKPSHGICILPHRRSFCEQKK